MKTTSLYKISLITILAGIIATGIVSCKKYNDWEADESYKRLFAPSEFTALVDGVNLTLKWKAKPNTNTYTVEFSKDSLKFTTIVRKYVMTGVKSADGYLFDIPDQLDPQTLYSVRIQGQDSAGTVPSNWTAITFRSGKFPSILNTPAISDITDEAVRVSWANTGDAPTTLKVLKAGDSSLVQQVTLAGTDVTNQAKVISGLKPGNGYIVYIYSGNTVRGWYDFSTKATLAGTIIDLRGITNVPGILADTLPDIASGSTIILKKGMIYEMKSNYAFNKTVSIISGDDLSSTAQAIINFVGTGANNFDVANGSVIDSITFTNVKITSDDVALGDKYAFNIGQACTIGKIVFESCTAQYGRGFFRTKDKAMTIGTVLINNCIISDIGNYGIVTIDNAANKIDNVIIRNSTIYKVNTSVVKNTKSSLGSVVAIENCTFNEAPFYATYLIDFDKVTVSTGINVQNCIFGVGKASGQNTSVKGARAVSAITGSNNFSTSDYSSTGNHIPGTTAYTAAASTVLFTDVLNGNFKITDALFPGRSSAGDPRWRP
jgi:hypothetical protein